MCLSPITIKNPYFGLSGVGINYLKNTSDSHITVPCGSCAQCCSLRQGFFSQRIQMESLRSHLFFFTLTYNNSSLTYVDVGDYHFPIPVISDVQNMFKRLRRKGYKFRYTYVSEYGSRRFRPHFHGILAVEKSDEHFSVVESRFKRLLSSNWCRNTSEDTFSPKYKSLYTPVFKHGRCTTFDFHHIEPVINHESDVSFYVSKYITKYDTRTTKLLQKISLDESLEPDEASFLISSLKPRCITSKDFGSPEYPPIRDYIISCVNRSKKLPQFFDLYTGKSMLLSRYYRNKCLGFDYLFDRFNLFSDYTDDNSFVIDDDSLLTDYKLSSLSNLQTSINFENAKSRLFSQLIDIDDDLY